MVQRVCASRCGPVGAALQVWLGMLPQCYHSGLLRCYHSVPTVVPQCYHSVTTVLPQCYHSGYHSVTTVDEIGKETVCRKGATMDTSKVGALSETAAFIVPSFM